VCHRSPTVPSLLFGTQQRTVLSGMQTGEVMLKQGWWRAATPPKGEPSMCAQSQFA